jgi:hypothetical protein
VVKKPKKSKKKTKQRQRQELSAPEQIRRWVMEDPSINAETVRKRLDKQGYQVTSFTISSLLASTKAVLRGYTQYQAQRFAGTEDKEQE